MVMNQMYFLLSLIVAVVILQIYLIYVKGKKKTGFENEKEILQLLEGSKDVIYHFEIKPKQKFRYISPSIEKFLGEGVIKEAAERIHAAFERVHPDDYESLCKKLNDELDYSKILIQRWKDNNGNYRWFEEHATPIYEHGKLIAVQGIMRNIDEKMKLQWDLEYRINHDALTGIYNREFFECIMEKYNNDVNTSVAIILCDLDELKHINDNYGHKKGDVFIKESAKILNHYFLKENGIVARIGGDEYAIILTDTSERQVDSHCKKFLNEISQYNINSDELAIEMSIGYAFTEHSIGNMENLFVKADKSMYRDKNMKKEYNSLG